MSAVHGESVGRDNHAGSYGCFGWQPTIVTILSRCEDEEHCTAQQQEQDYPCPLCTLGPYWYLGAIQISHDHILAYFRPHLPLLWSCVFIWPPPPSTKMITVAIKCDHILTPSRPPLPPLWSFVIICDFVQTVHTNFHAKSGLCSSRNEWVMRNLVFGAIPCRAVPPVTNLHIELRASRQLIIQSMLTSLQVQSLDKS